ncbi:MAG TPA: trehalose-phosphatase [Polyangiales bacterium]|nr:trehalose-phosphatase [Polyangiales bacterium]
MKHILSHANVDLLAQLACSRVLLAFDYDGTLAPIVAARDHADMRARTRKLLADVCELYPCAVISGRSRKDVGARITSARVKYVIGNHGLEPGKNIASFERAIKAVTPQLERQLTDVRGVEIEDKRYSLSVHYRGARGKQRARAAIEAAVRRLDQPMRMIAGKLLVNVVPEGAPHKGDALDALRAREGADTALYVGDDSTDEDVFELDQPGQLLGIRIGQARDSAAAYYLRDQREIDVLLSKLRALRRNGRS